MLVVEKTAEMNQYGFDILVISECKEDYKHELAKPSYTRSDRDDDAHHSGVAIFMSKKAARSLDSWRKPRLL